MMRRLIPLLATALVVMSASAQTFHVQPAQAQAPAQAQTQQVPSAPTTRLNLDQARQMALANHPRFLGAQYAAAAQHNVTTEVRSAYYPVVSGDLTGAVAVPGSRIAAGALNNPIVYDRFATGLSVQQLVADFGRTRNLVASADLQAKAADAQVNFSREDVLVGVDRAFYQALRAQAVLRVAQQTVQERSLVSQQVTALEQSKLKSSLDVSFANVNLSEAQLLLLQAQNDAQASSAVLSAALGLSGQRQFELVEPESAPATLPALADALVSADQNRPELAALRLQVQSARRFATAERDLWMPTVSLVGAAGEIPYGQSPLPENYAAAAFDVHIPIFNGKLFNARHAEALNRAREASEQFRDVQNAVSRDVQTAWLAANTAYQDVAVTAQFLDQANLALNLATARYHLGLSSIVELSQAQLNQAQAAIAQATAKYDYDTRFAELAYQEGILH
jgi:outer membrane protein